MTLSAPLLIALARSVAVLGAILSTVPYLVLTERKVCAYIQDRIGPNRVGPWGLLQPLADGLKLLLKEDIRPNNVDRWLFVIAPPLALIPAIGTFAVVPFGSSITLFGHTVRLQVADPGIGVMLFLAIGALSVYGIALGGWASNNKYSLMGGLRACAQLISYELVLGLALVGLFMVSGSATLSRIVDQQSGTFFGVLPRWNVFIQPVGFLAFLVAAFAENNRLPFDLPEAEPELVGGYHTEYTGLRFGTFMLAENASMITISALLVTLYLGGYHLPWLTTQDWGPVLGGLITLGVFSAKMAAVLLFIVTIRWTLPRFKYTKLMQLSWKGLVPLALANILITGAAQVLLH